MALNNLPRNTSLKPTGYFDAFSGYFAKFPDSKVKVYAIYPSLTTKLVVDKAFYDAFSSFTKYDPAVESGDNVTLSCTTDYKLAVIPYGRIIANNVSMVAVITEENQLLSEVSLQYDVDREAKGKDSLVFRRKYFSTPLFINGTVFNMLGGGGTINNIGHWMLDALARLNFLKEAGLFDEVDYFLVPNFAHEFQKESLQLFGIAPERIVVADGETHFQAERLISTSHPRGARSYLVPHWLISFYQNTIGEKAKALNTNYPSKIYVSRRDSKLRGIENEDQLISFLESEGYTTLEMSKYSLLEKVAIFQQAESIIGMSGAGLIGLLFANRGMQFLELFPRGFVHSLYYNIANFLDMDYQYLICDSASKSEDIKKAQLEDIRVDISDIKKITDGWKVPKY